MSTKGGAIQDGYGVHMTIASQQVPSPGTYADFNVLTIYDVAGNPRWVEGRHDELVTTPPQIGEERTINLRYHRAGPAYTLGIPINDCSVPTPSGPNNCFVSTLGVGTLQRTFINEFTAAATIHVSVSSASTGNAAVSWHRPASGTAPVTLNKLSAATGIVVDRNECVVPVSQSTCPIAVNWAAINQNYRAQRRDLVGGGVLAIGTSPSGEYTDNLTAGARVRYELVEYGIVRMYTPEVLAYANPAPATPPAPDGRAAPAASTVSDGVGASLGVFRVDESGSATYRMPIFMPPGSGGMSPQLALYYSSSAADGAAGMGWSLSGYSAITRCRKTAESGDGSDLRVSIDYSVNDQFCLDGQRLLAVTSTDGTGRPEFRTEIDGFTKVVIDSSDSVTINGVVVSVPRVWIAFGKDGSVRRFGDAGRTNPQTSTSVDLKGRSLARLGTTDVVVAWLQTELGDRTGNNRVLFEHEQLGTSSDGEHRLRRVYYNGGRVSLDYGTRTAGAIDAQYLGGAAIRRSQRLTAISVEAETARNTFSAVRSYTLCYFGDNAGNCNGVPDGVAAVNGFRDRLKGVKECNGAVCYPATKFDWSSAIVGGTQSTGSTDVDATKYFKGLNGFKYGDIDGDGRADIVWCRR